MTHKDHIVMDLRSESLLCENCGGTYKIHMPCAIDMWIAQSEVFVDRHHDCAKTWTPPLPFVFAPTLVDKQSRIKEWLENGERGISSNTMLEVITGIQCVFDIRSHPYDPTDFKRCWKLLTAVPELREGFPALANESKVWKALVENWDELAAMMPGVLKEWEEKLVYRSTYPTVKRMYERMKQLGC